MSVIEKSSLMQYKGADGNMYAVHPVTDTDNVKGLEEWNKAMLLNNVAVALPSKANWYSVCYGDGKFVAITGLSSGITAYSTDGINWTRTTLPANKDWRSVCYGDGKFVTVSYGANVAAYSTDGINWTQTTLPASKNWRSVCYGDGKFVAISFGGSIAVYSTDGINWTQTTLPISSYWYSVCYGDGKFVVVSSSGSATTYPIAYSTDGITWTSTTVPKSYVWSSSCYGGGKFVAMYNTMAMYSTNGIDWILSEPLNANQQWDSVCYGDGKFVSVSKGNSIAIYSTDGINWTQTTLPASKNWRSVCYGDGKFVAVAYDSDIVAYSTDGVNWTDKDTSVKNPASENVTDSLKEVLGIDGLQAELDGKAPESHTHTKDQISDFPTSMPASDVSAWAKASTKPTYTASEVGADASGAAATALTDAKAYTDSAIQTAIQNTWEASY